jgi:hypothetical protein
MAALVCDICGGKLIMGQGGIAFCDSCGLEYSQQRLKEKIIDGMDSVHSDHTSIIDHWMRMGKAASESGNYRGAYDYYVKVLELEPNNWRAIYEKGKSGAWQSTLDNLRTSELHQAVNEALIIIADLDLQEDEICQLKNEFAVELVKLNSFITDSVNDNFKIIPEKSFYMHWDKMWDRRERFISNISIVENAMLLIADYDDAVSKAHVIDFKKRVCSDLCMVCKPVGYWYDQGHTSLQYFGFNSFEKREYIEKFWDYVYDIREIEPDYRVKMSEQPDPFEPANNSDWDIYEYWQKHSDEQLARRERFYSKKRYDQYWEEHHEEKSQLLSRREEIKKELNSIKAQIYVFTS